MTPQEQGAAIAGARLDGQKLADYPGPAPAGMHAAYEVQAEMARAMGQPQAGWKVGCTNETARKALGLDRPFYGPLFAPGITRTPACVTTDAGWLGIVEVEIAVRMAHDLDPGAAPDAVIAAIGTVHPALEYVAKRLPGGPVEKAEWVVADGAFNAGLVLGPGLAFDPAMDLQSETTEMWRDGERVAVGSGGLVDSGPLGVLIWLAGVLADRGIGLRAGDFVSTGLTTPVVPVSPGQAVEGRFATLGRVEARFLPEG